LLFNDAFLDNCSLVKGFVVSKHEVRGQPLFSSQDPLNAKRVIKLPIFQDALIVIHLFVAFFIVIIIIVFIIVLLIIWLHICFFGFWFRIKLILDVLNLPLQLLIWILHKVSQHFLHANLFSLVFQTFASEDGVKCSIDMSADLGVSVLHHL
jgi:hypothetical protein